MVMTWWWHGDDDDDDNKLKEVWTKKKKKYFVLAFYNRGHGNFLYQNIGLDIPYCFSCAITYYL